MLPAVSVLLAMLVAQNQQLTPQEERGRQIFEHGTSASGKTIEALLAGSTRMPASILPCANCHGYDGLGRPEGGVVPPNITWEALTKPYGLTHSDGRVHPPYTERLLRRAITMGIDPAGESLNTTMPRFQLTMADATDLISYIKKLGWPVDPGLTDTTVHLGVILPPPSQGAKTSRIIQQALLKYFAHVNEAGGVFGRRIELAFTELPVEPTNRAGAISDFLRREQVFAVVGADFTGAESEIAAVMLRTGTPTIAALALLPQTDSPLNRYVFYLDGGVKEEVDALLAFAAKRFPGQSYRAAIISSDEENSREAAKWLRARLTESKFGHLVAANVQSSLGADLVFWLNSGLQSPPIAAGRDNRTTILIPGSLAAEVSSAPPNAEIFVARCAPSLPESAALDANSLERISWERAIASAEIITEGITRAGRNLSRAGLIQSLESFSNVQTSLPEAVSFGPNRRVGAGQVRVMRFDRQSQKLISVESDAHASAVGVH